MRGHADFPREAHPALDTQSAVERTLGRWIVHRLQCRQPAIFEQSFVAHSVGRDVDARPSAFVFLKLPSRRAPFSQVSVPLPSGRLLTNVPTTRFELQENFCTPDRSSSLRDTDLSITEIADRIGCASHSHFSVMFHRMTGRTARDYRRETGATWQGRH